MKTSLDLRTREAGIVAPQLGWKTPGGGRAAWAKPARRYEATTTQAAGLFPFVAGSGAPTDGVPLGRHLLWGETVCADPFAWMRAGITTNTGWFLLGQPGVGKSALAKRLTMGMAAFGVRPIILGDTKGEHTAVINMLGGQVIRVGRGLDRINPLDSGPLGQVIAQLPAHRAQQLTLEVRGRRLDALLALCSLVRAGRGIANGEEVLLGRAADLLTHNLGRSPDPTVPDVLALLRNPPQALVDAAETRTQRDYDNATRELRRTLNLLCEGTLKGVFDQSTTQPINLAAPGVAVDISATAAAGDKIVAAAMLSTWAFGFATVDAHTLLADAGLTPSLLHLMVMDELWRLLRGAGGLVERADALTRLNRSMGIASLMIAHTLRDLLALSTAEDVAKARGFVERAAVIILGGLPMRELAEISEISPLSAAEMELVSGWSASETWQPGGARHPGRGNYLIKAGRRPGLPLGMELTPTETTTYDTDTRIRT